MQLSASFGNVLARFVLVALAALVHFSQGGALAQDCPVLIWSDEFEGTTLDPEKWTPQIGDGCPGLCGWGNNELQYYRAENATVSDGTLKITAREEPFSGRQYTSSRLRTRGYGEWTFGRFEARMKLPEGQGIWPAFWMMPTDEVYGGWPTSGEIDVMELVGHQPDVVHGTIHFGPSWPNNRMSGASFRRHEGSFSEEWHVFAVDREPGEIRWYVDDVLYATKTEADTAPFGWPFDERFHVLLNLAVGGNWPGSPDATTVFPQVLEVDYVRVYEGSRPYVAGPRTVRHAQAGTVYEVSNVSESANIQWSAPLHAVIVDGQGTPAVAIDWGTSGGRVSAQIVSDCGSEELAIDVLVRPAYARALTFENFDGENAISRVFSSGTFSVVDNPSPVGINVSARSARYVRSSGSRYDVLIYQTSAIPDASGYVAEDARFYLDLYTNAPVGTTIILQLENAARATAEYPVGRHSRYEVTTSVQDAWERLEFEYLDQPDASTPHNSVDRIVLLFAPDTFTGHTYYWDNFDGYVRDDAATSAHDEPHGLPAGHLLSQNYPNPFSGGTRIAYRLDAREWVSLHVFNLLGERLATLVDGAREPGEHVEVFSASGLPSGTYVYRLNAGRRSEGRMMTVVR